MRSLIRKFDALLCQIYGVYTFSDDPNCIFRLQLTKAPHTLDFTGNVVHAGEKVLMLHLWNEHIPASPEAGPNMAWAVRTRRLLVRSLHAVSRHMRLSPNLADVNAVGGVISLPSQEDHSGGVRLLQRLGFMVSPCRSSLGRLLESCENFYSWGLMWTFNPTSQRRKKLLRLRRFELWMLTEDFLSLYE